MVSNLAATAGSAVNFTCKYDGAAYRAPRWMYVKPRQADRMEVCADPHFAGRFTLNDDSANERHELSIISVRVKDAGMYSCIVESAEGRLITVYTADLTVHGE